MIDPWFAAALVFGLVLSKRFTSTIAPWRPFVVLGSLAFAGITFVGLVLIQGSSPSSRAWDISLSLLIGAAFGVAAGAVDIKEEGYLVRGEEPEEE